MLFSIVIPAYKAANMLHLPLASLATQMFRDFEVLIIDDNSPLDEFNKTVAVVEKFKEYIDISVIPRTVNGGCGPTLQTGLDACNGDYFIPIDADDMFATPETLLHFARLIQQHKYPDAVCTSFMEYDPETGRMTLIDQNNSAFVHGKAYKVQYCRENNITFPNQKWFEDGAFNFLALNISPNVIREATVTYLWQANKNSITRSQDYNVLVMPYYMAAYTRAFPVLAQKDPRKANFFMCGLLAYGYYYWNAFMYRKFDKSKDRIKVAKEQTDGLIKLIGDALEQTKLIDAINKDRGVFDEYIRNDSRCKGMIEGQESAFLVSMDLNRWLNFFFKKSIKWLEV